LKTVSLMESRETKRTIRTFTLASFLNDFGSDMIYPVWPLFVTTVLGADMAVLGFIDGLGDAIVSISQAASGYVSDRIRRRKVFVWSGYLFGSSSRIGYALSAVWQHVIPFRILDRAGKMRGAPRDAIIADASSNENRGRNFGLLRAMDNLGAVCGIIVCLLFILMLGQAQYRSLFVIAAIPSIVGALLVFLLIKEPKSSGIRLYKGLLLKQFDMNFGLFFLLSAFFALGSFSYSFLLIYAKTFGFEPLALIMLYLTFTAVASIFSLPFGKLSDRMGRKFVLLLSFAFWGFTCLSFIAIQNYLAIIVTFVLYGLHKGALEPVQRAFVAELAPFEYRASILGGFQMVVGFCALPSSLIAGLLWDQFNPSAPFYLSFALTILAIAMLFFVKEKPKR
jgi:MFS family permease